MHNIVDLILQEFFSLKVQVETQRNRIGVKVNGCMWSILVHYIRTTCLSEHLWGQLWRILSTTGITQLIISPIGLQNHILGHMHYL